MKDLVGTLKHFENSLIKAKEHLNDPDISVSDYFFITKIILEIEKERQRLASSVG